MESPGLLVIDPAETAGSAFKDFHLVLLPKLMKLYDGTTLRSRMDFL